MGAAARQRGDKVIRDQAKPEKITVDSEYVSRLEMAVNNLIADKRKLQHDIKKARLKIERLRAENSVLAVENSELKKILAILKDAGVEVVEK